MQNIIQRLSNAVHPPFSVDVRSKKKYCLPALILYCRNIAEKSIIWSSMWNNDHNHYLNFEVKSLYLWHELSDHFRSSACHSKLNFKYEYIKDLRQIFSTT